jgi:hypothetical protein
MATSVVAIEL